MNSYFELNSQIFCFWLYSRIHSDIDIQSISRFVSINQFGSAIETQSLEFWKWRWGFLCSRKVDVVSSWVIVKFFKYWKIQKTQLLFSRNWRACVFNFQIIPINSEISFVKVINICFQDSVPNNLLPFSSRTLRFNIICL